MGTGIKTNGEGKRFTGHLNLTATLADIWRLPRPMPTRPLVVFKRPPKPIERTRAQKIVADGYASGKPTKVIAAEAGINPNSVSVLAGRMGISRPPRQPKPIAKRIPPYAGYDPREPRWGGKSITGALNE